MSTRFATFNAIYDVPYIDLTTFRKKGTAVSTPVWFAQDMQSGILYVETGADSGKVKRIRRTARVTLAPCTIRGKITGPIVAGKARVVKDTTEIFKARGALHRKYGFQRQLFYSIGALIALITRKTGGSDAYIAIEPAEE